MEGRLAEVAGQGLHRHRPGSASLGSARPRFIPCERGADWACQPVPKIGGIVARSALGRPCAELPRCHAPSADRLQGKSTRNERADGCWDSKVASSNTKRAIGALSRS